MGFFSDLFGRKSTPNPMSMWGQYGPGATQQFIGGQQRYAIKGRRKQLELLSKAYRTRRKGLSTGFEQELKRVKTGVERSAASRGLGKSTIALALKPTETLTAQRMQALSNLRGQFYEQRAGIKDVPIHLFQYMRQKSRHGALEPWELYRQEFRGKSPLGTLAGAAIGGFFGGPAGASAGAQIGGSL